jgi:hypothetical protein
VFVPGDEGTAKFQSVTLGMSEPAQIEVIAGLDEGARIITTGAAALREGDRVIPLGQGGRNNGQGGGRGNGEGRGRRGGASASAQ